MSNELLTIAEIAKALNMAESTVRYYRDRFTEFIPSVGEGRNKRYKLDSIEVIKLIAEGLRNKLTAEEVAEQLKRIYPIFIDDDKGVAVTAAAAQQQDVKYITSAFYKAFKETKEIVTATTAAVTQLTSTVAQLQEEKAALVEKNNRLFDMYHNDRTALENEIKELRSKLENEQKKGILAKLFKR